MAKATSVGKRYAVIVGVTGYDDDQVARLQYTRNDAVRLADVLVQHCGFDQNRVYLLVDDPDPMPGTLRVAGPPTRGEVLHRVKHVTAAAGEDDLLLFFFAGHGSEVSTNPYLLTSDTKLDILQHTAVDVSDLNDMCEKTKARCVVRIFDACRSPFGEARGLTNGRMTDRLEEAMLKTATGWASISSCSSGQAAHESGEFDQGVFSYYLCEGLEGKAANEECEVTLERLVDYVKISVSNWSEQQSRQQTPHVQSDLSGVLVMASVKGNPPRPTGGLADPLAILRSGIGLHLSQAPEDTRNLTFTEAPGLDVVVRLTQRALGVSVLGFEHPSMSISVGEAHPIVGGVWNDLMREISAKGVSAEFQNPAVVIPIAFSSSEVVVPRTALNVVVARFSFFYWIWYCHECLQQQLQGSFSAHSRKKTGFFTFKPRAGISETKVEDAVNELLKRASEDILDWAQQLGQYVDSRLDPLRAMGPVID